MTPFSSSWERILHDPFGGGNHGVFRVAAGGKSVGGRLRQGVNLGHRQLVGLADLGDDIEKRAAGDLVAAIHLDDDLVGKPVRAHVHDTGQDQGEEGALLAADHAADKNQAEG